MGEGVEVVGVGKVGGRVVVEGVGWGENGGGLVQQLYQWPERDIKLARTKG